jgi:hypothetical protein
MGIFDSLFGDAPNPPNPRQLISQQNRANQQAFRQGLVSTSGPFGSATYTTNKRGTSLATNLSPGQQAIFDPAQTAAANYAGMLPFSRFTLDDIPQGMDIAGTFFNQQRALLDPVFAERNRDLEVRAAERGLPIGSEAYSALMDPEARAQKLALQQAADRAVLMTPQEQQRQLANALTIRGLPFQEALGALGIQNAIQLPQVMSPLSAPQATNVAGILQQDYANRAAQYASDQSGLSSLLGSAAMLPFLPLSGTLAGSWLGIT